MMRNNKSQVRELQQEGRIGSKLLFPNVGTSGECSRNREQDSVAGKHRIGER